MAFDITKIGVKKNIPKVNFLEYTGIFEAPEKFGKTAFASLYPNAILVASEKGYMAQVMNVKDVHIWDDFVEFLDSLEEHREEIGNDIQTIIIDTVDELYPMAVPYVCRMQGIRDKTTYKEIKDIPFGQGWNYHDAEFKRQIKRIHAMGFTLLYLTHSTVKQIKPKNGEAYDVYKSTMSDRCANIVYPACDFIIHGERRKVEVAKGKHEMKRVLTVRGSDEAVAGSRVSFDDDVVFDTEEEAMEKFQAKFKEGIIRNLEKAGIKTDFETLAEQQMKEKQEEIQNFIKEKKSQQDPEVLIKEIEALAKKLPKTKQTKAGVEIKNILGDSNFRKFISEEDVPKLLEVIEMLKEHAGE